MRVMWMAELARRSGLPVATIKYYLREGLLPPGEATSATRAVYDETHLRRLRLVRALTDVAGLRLDAVRDVLAAVDDESLSWHDAVGSAHTRLSAGMSAGAAASQPDAADGSAGFAAADEQVQRLLRRHHWELSSHSPHAAVLARALAVLDALGHHPDDELLDVYAQAATLVAEHEVAGIPADGHVTAAERVVVGTLLHEPVLLTIRRIAQENVSRRSRSGRATEG